MYCQLDIRTIGSIRDITFDLLSPNVRLSGQLDHNLFFLLCQYVILLFIKKFLNSILILKI